MQVKRVVLNRWCQLHGEYEFGPGLNCIRGPNGAGKTNLVNAIVFALTGDLSRLHGVKADNVSVSATKGDVSDVTLYFTHENVAAKIVRTLQPKSSQELSLDCEGNVRKWTRDSEIVTELEKFLGVKQRMLLDYVFVPQWGIFRFIDQSPSVRAKALSELFGADRVEKIYNDLGEYGRVELVYDPADVDVLRQAVRDQEVEIETLTTELARMPVQSTNVGQFVQDVNSFSERLSHLRLINSHIKDCNKTILVTECRIQDLEGIRATLEREIIGQVKEFDELSPKAAKVQPCVEQWDAFDKYNNDSKRLNGSILYLRDEIAKLRSSLDQAPDDDYINPDHRAAYEERLYAFKRDREHFADILNRFTTGKELAACPLCDTPVGAMAHRLDDYSFKVVELDKAINVLSRRVHASNRRDRQVANTVTAIVEREAKLGVYEQQLSQLAVVAEPEMTLQDCHRLIKEFSDVCNRAHEIRLRVDHVNLQIEEANKTVEKLQRQLAALEQERREYADIDESTAEAKCEAMIAEMNQMIQRREMECELTMLRRNLDSNLASLQQCLVSQAKADSVRRESEHLQKVREVYKELMRVIPQHSMRLLQSDVNEILERFDARFRVDSIDDLRFQLRYTDGRVQPAERLSGGERVLLALAFRITINSRYTRELGLLCLDEPTAGLDEDNIRCIQVAIDRLRDMSRSRGLQVIMVTHDAGLDNLFDHVIRLGHW
jgi:DNA repair exonuclease SbcCD ATPase subunit